jgi:hypothetical protein
MYFSLKSLFMYNENTTKCKIVNFTISEKYLCSLLHQTLVNYLRTTDGIDSYKTKAVKTNNDCGF